MSPADPWAFVDISGDLPDVRHATTGPDGPFPIIDRRGRSWGADDVRGFWRAVGSERMSAALARHGPDTWRASPLVFEESRLFLERAVQLVSVGMLTALAVTGARDGFLDAAIGCWGVYAHEQMRRTLQDGCPPDTVRLRIEREVAVWCTTYPTLTDVIMDAVAVGFTRGAAEYEEATRLPGPAAIEPRRHRHRLEAAPA